MPACVLQYPLTVAIGRYTLLTGEGVPRGLCRVHAALAALAVALTVVLGLSLGAFASAAGEALGALTQMPGGFTMRGRALLWAHAAVTVPLVTIALSGGAWRTVERAMKAATLLTAVGLLWACAHPEMRSALPTFVTALAGPPGPSERAWDVNDSATLLIALAFVGLGGPRSLLYSYWIRAAGAGMAVAGGRPPTGEGLGRHSVDDGPASAAAWRRWRRWLRIDVLIAIGGHLVVTLLACLVAYAVLYPRGILPADYDVAALQMTLADVGWGARGRIVFLLVTAALLTAAWLASADGASRMWAEILTGPGAARGATRTPAAYHSVLAVLTVVTCGTLWVETPASALALATAIGFSAAILLPPALYVLNHRRLARVVPPWARPRALEGFLLVASTVVYALLGCAYGWAAWPWW